MAELEKRSNIMNENIYLTNKYVMNGFDAVEVEKIIDTRLGKDQKRYYFVRFKSWLGEEKLLDYDYLIQQFWKQRDGDADGESDCVSDDGSQSDKENKYDGTDDCTLNRTSNFKPTFVTKEIGDENNDGESPENGVEDELPENGVEDELPKKPEGLREEDMAEFLQNGAIDEYSNISSSSGEVVPAQENIASDNFDESPNIEEEFGSNDTEIFSDANDVSSEQLSISTEYPVPAEDSKQDSSKNEEQNVLKRDFRPSSSNSDYPTKKRKTLDDIVRKISRITDQHLEKKTSRIEEMFSDRQNLDERLLNGKMKVEEQELPHYQKTESSESERDSCLETERHASFPEYQGRASNSDNANNIYWSAGKAFHKLTRTYKCPCCEHRFETEESLFEHQQTHNMYACQDCNDIFPSLPDLGEHQKTHNNYTCRTCNDTFKTLSAFDAHRVTVHRQRQKYEKCRFCSTLYSDPVQLRRHEKSHFPGYEMYPNNKSGPPPPLYKKENGSPPPLIQDNRETSQYQKQSEVSHKGNGYHNDQRMEKNSLFHSPQGSDGQMEIGRNGDHAHGEEDASIIRNPIRNLLGKMHQSQRVFEHEILPNKSSFKQYVPHPDECRDVDMLHTIHHDDARRMEYHVRGEQDRLKEEPENEFDKDSLRFRELVHLCPICSKSFGKKETFDLHWRSAHPDTPVFPCDVCKETFFNQKVYDSHMASHMKYTFVCRICRKVFDRKSAFEIHMRSHTMERPFQCRICRRSFSLRTNLRRHMAIHTDMTLYRCSFCGKGFRRPDLLKEHVVQHHPIQMEELRRQNENLNNPNHPFSSATNPISPVYNKFPQNLQSETNSPANRNVSPNQFHFRYRQHYVDESKIYPYDLKMNQSNPIGSRVSNLPTVHHHASEGSLYHKQNGKEGEPEELKIEPAINSLTYSSEKQNATSQQRCSMKCEECSEEFTSLSLFEIHLQSHVQEVFSCPKCPKTFTKRTVYDAHVQTHDTNKSHNCPYCHRSFSMKGNLRRHIRIHTNEAPYECPICFQRFRRSDGLKGHIKRHETMGETAPTDMVPSQASA